MSGRAGPAATLDQLVLEVAASPLEARILLASCQFCRNRLLYLLDPAPVRSMNAFRGVLRARIRALPENHDLSHQNPDAAGHGDARLPHIHWVAP